MYQPGAIVQIFRDLSLIQCARFMAMLFAIRLLLTFWISFHRDQRECLEVELPTLQHSQHYIRRLPTLPRRMINVITASIWDQTLRLFYGGFFYCVLNSGLLREVPL